MDIQQLMVSNLFTLRTPAGISTDHRNAEGNTARIQQSAPFFQISMNLVPGILREIWAVQGQ
ncbi:hypothetical protein D3C75_1294600 [compost metagenome]